MNETYPTEPTLILSEDVYALRISVFEDGTDMCLLEYDEEEQAALRECLDDLIGHSSGNFMFEFDSVIGEENEWVPILVCRLQEGFRVPFPVSVLEHTVYYSNGEEKKLVGMKMRVHPRSDHYRWAEKVEILLEEYDE